MTTSETKLDRDAVWEARDEMTSPSWLEDTEEITDAPPLKRKRASNMLQPPRVETGVVLPPLPRSELWLEYPFPAESLIAFCGGSIDARRSQKPDVPLDHPLHAYVDLLDARMKKIEYEDEEGHDELDETLALERELMGITANVSSRPARNQGIRRTSLDEVAHSWFRKPTIAGAAATRRTRPTASATGAVVGHGKTTDGRGHVNAARTPASVLQDIEESFAFHSVAPVHTKDPTLVPVSVIPVFPNFDVESNQFSFVRFDRVNVKSGPGLLYQGDREAENRNHDYYVPQKDAQISESSQAYVWKARYTDMNVRSKPERKDSLFFVKTNHALLYSELQASAFLKRQRDYSTENVDALRTVPEKILFENQTL